MKSILVYLALVGMPVLGLLWVLKIGDGLDAPASIGGAWTVDETTARALARSCAPRERSKDELEMMISQSGRFVQLQFNDTEQTAMKGRLDDSTLTVRQVLASRTSARNDCATTTPAVLRVQLRRSSGGAEQLSGTWRIPGCDECSPTPFSSARLSRP